MSNNNSAAEELNNFLITRNLEVTSLNAKTGQQPVNDAGKFDINKSNDFSFDYISSSGKNYGRVEILLTPEAMLVASGANTGRGMDPADKPEWFDVFLTGLKNIAVGHNLLTFDISNFAKLKMARQGMASISEGFSGNKRYSFSASPTEARLMIKHNRIMSENDARFRYIESIFIETAEGERWKLKSCSLTEGRAQLQHVKQGGNPYDQRGQHISEMINQAKVLSQFRRAQHGKILEAAAQSLVNETNDYYYGLRKNLKSMSTTSGYKQYFESWNADSLTERDIVVEDLKDLFIETRIDPRIEQALPLLAYIKETKMKEADIFEDWADSVVNGTDITPEEEKNLKMLMSQPLQVGADATNAIEQLPRNLANDEELTDILLDLAVADPNANIWENPQVVHRLQELDIDIEDVTGLPPEIPAVESIDESATNGDMVVQDLINGKLDAYQVMTSPNTPEEQYVSKLMQDMYSDVSIDRGLNPDNDISDILTIIVDRLAHEHGRSPDVDEGAFGATLGGAAGAILTKTPGGALAGADIGSKIQDTLSNESTDLRRLKQLLKLI
jgi:hypothetical protein